jgi:hypothetical protein
MTELNPTDYRRAAALINFRADGNTAGIHSVLVEAAQTNRVTPLLSATVETYDYHLGRLRTPDSLPLVTEWLQQQAAAEAFNAATTRAAAVILAVRDRDQTKFAQLATEANQTADGPGILVGAITDLYSMLLPELSTLTGLKQLNDWSTAPHASRTIPTRTPISNSPAVRPRSGSDAASSMNRRPARLT